jgi:thiamine-phosphate pyrophosphorylase
VNLTRPVLCLVTDRRRLGARLGSPPDARATVDALLVQVTAAAEAGVGLVQVREAELPDSALVALVRAIRDRVVPRGARVVVNDRLDVALASGADGVHLKSASIPVVEALRLAPPGWLIGRSVHTVAEIERGLAVGAHYLIFGSVFPTASKPAGWNTAGLAGLAAAVRAASPVPVLGIGGIGLDQARDVAATGAAGLAAIDAFLPPQSTRIAHTVQEAVRRMRMAFDSSVGPS